MRVLVTSEQDSASKTIASVLLDEYDFEETGSMFEGHPVYRLDSEDALLIMSERDLINCGHLDAHFDAEAFIFCSRHKAKSGRPALLVHSTGNFGDEALFGGQPRSLSVSTASLVSRALRSLVRERERLGLDEFDVSLEVTHHGPTELNTPMLFVELGSDESHWNHVEGARAVASAVMDSLREPFAEECAIGFGGNHYASKFSKAVLSGGLLIGHIAPKYALDGLSPQMVREMVRRCRERVTAAVIDWKGTNAGQRSQVLPVLDEIGIETVRLG